MFVVIVPPIAELPSYRETHIGTTYRIAALRFGSRDNLQQCNNEVRGTHENNTPQPLQEVQCETTSYEVDPLVCPKCGGEMRIIAFIIDHDVVDAILRHLAKAEARSPRGPPGAGVFSVAS
jgi:hypothetical protein